MAETELIAKMAEKLAKELFGIFGWKQKGPINQNWTCVEKAHDKATHPSDVVFSYEDPYTDQRIYVNCDLKSYGKHSITKATIAGGLRSMAIAVECANRSDAWQELYVGEAQWEGVGLLFVYNHDGEFDTDFDKIRDLVDANTIDIAYARRMFVLGPKRIAYLASVANDIRVLRGDGAVPAASECGFYYPDLISKRPKHSTQNAASLEALAAPWQILRFQKAVGSVTEEHFVVYYDGALADVDECKYLIDFFFRYQLLRNDSTISVRAPFCTPEAHVLMSKAKEAYFEAFYSLPEFRERLERIQMGDMTSIVKQFSSISLGM
jgi:hypothetical protein